MADGKILRSDIIDDKAIEGLREMGTHIDKIAKQFNEVISVSIQFKEALKGLGDMKSVQQAMKANTDNIKKYNAVIKQLQDQKQKYLKLIQQERAELEKLRKATTSAEVATTKTAKSQGILAKSFRGLLSSVKSLIGAYVGLYAVVGLIRKVFRDTRELDKLQLTYKSVIKDTHELAQTTEWLSDVSQRYGLDLLNLSERYVKFRAATLSSKITVEETQKVFESFSKASAVLGLRTDEVGGVFLALEQMMSKGKVTTEELRRQLGERLPGAFQIMAKALDVSTRELDRMLKAGEVLSEEVLPKFAKTMEDVYGISTVNRIDTLAAAQGRFNKAWLDFVSAMKLSGFFQDTFNEFGKMLNFLSSGSRDIIDNMRLQNEEFDKQMALVDELTAAEVASFDIRKKLIDEMLKHDSRKTRAEKAYEQYLKKRIKQEEEALAREKDVANYRAKTTEDLSTLEGIYVAGMIEITQKIKDLTKEQLGSGDERVAQIQKEIKEYEKLHQGIMNMLLLVQRVQKEREDDMEKFRSEIQSIGEGYEKYAIYSEKSKEAFLEGNFAFRESLKTGAKSYEAYLRGLLKSTELSVQRRMVVEEELSALMSSKNKGRKIKDDSIDKEKELQKSLVEEVKSNQEKALAERIKTEQLTSDEISTIRERNSLVILYMEQDHIRQLIEMTKVGSEERLSLEADLKEKVADINKSKTDIAIDEMRREVDEEKRLAKERLNLQKEENENAELTIDEWIASQILARQKLATEDIKANKNSAEKVAEIQSAAELDIMRILERGALLKANLYEDDTIEYRKWMLEKERISEDTEKAIQDNQKKTAKLSQEQVSALISFMGDSVNTGFEVIRSFQTDNLAIADDAYRREMILAGDSQTKRIAAEEKYYKAKKDLAKKQAVLDKAQSIFNIGLSTAQAIMKVWETWAGNPVLAGIMTGIVSALGAAQIAAVLAQQVPAYEKGGITEGGVALVSENGSEMAILPSGKQIITPETPTLMGFPKGTEIIPHEETARLLAESARNNFIRETIDLSMTNNYLRSIRDKESVTIVDGYKYVNKNGIRGRYALGI